VPTAERRSTSRAMTFTGPDASAYRGTPAGDREDRTVTLVATHEREIDRKQPADLLNHRGEHLLRGYPSRHQRRDPPQRRLLLSKHTQFVTTQRNSRSNIGRALRR